MPAREIILDVRELEPPEPYELATETLTDLGSGQFVHMICPRRPHHLYPWLTERGFREDTRQRNHDLYEVFIWAEDDTDSAAVIAAMP